MHTLITLLLLTATASAQTADQIDYVLRYASPAAALAAGELAGVVIPACPSCTPPTPLTFSGAVVIAPVQAWKTTAIGPSGTLDPTCGCYPIVETRTYLSPASYWVLVSTVGRNAAIEASAGLMLEADRTMACAGLPASQWLLANNTGVTAAQLGSGVLPTYHLEPQFAGSCYHIGGGP